MFSCFRIIPEFNCLALHQFARFFVVYIDSLILRDLGLLDAAVGVLYREHGEHIIEVFGA